MPKNSKCVFWQRSIDSTFIKNFDQCASNQKAVLVIGDSHAMNIYGALARNEAFPFLVSISMGNCRIYGNNTDCDYKPIKDFIISRGDKFHFIIYHQTARFLFDTDGSRDSLLKIFDPKNTPTIGYNKENVYFVASFLEDLPKDIDVYWLGPRVETFITKDVLWKSLNMSFKLNDGVLKKYQFLDEQLGLYIQENRYSFKYLSLQDILEFDKKTFLIMEDCITYRDSDHYSICGEQIFGKYIADSLSRLSH